MYFFHSFYTILLHWCSHFSLSIFFLLESSDYFMASFLLGEKDSVSGR